MCVGGRVLIIFFSLQTPMKRVWNPLLPQIDCESLCKRQNIWKPASPNLGFWQWDIMNTINVRLHVNQTSRGVVVSLACYSYSKLVRLGGDYFENFRIKVSIFFFLTKFSLAYRYTHGVWNRKMYCLALIYFQGCKCRGGVKCLW